MTSNFETARAHFQRGVALFEAGDATGAEAALRASLALLPGRPSTLVNLGAVLLHLGRPEEALAALDETLAVDGQQPDAWCHRALACSALGREGEALAGLQRAFALGCQLPAAHQHHALVLNRLGRHEEALAALQPLLATQGPAEPGHAAAQLLRGQTCQTLGRLSEARSAFEAAVAANPQLAEAWVQLGLLLNELGETPLARQALQRARETLGQETGDAAVQAGDQARSADDAAAMLAYFSAAVGDGAPPATAPPAYVRALFDPYAEGFEEHLVGTLRYCGHEAVVTAALAWRATAPPAGTAAGPAAEPGRGPSLALDLGCGSGLSGAFLRPHAQRLEGVDLSPTMVAQARASGHYDAVFEAELVQHLQALAAAGEQADLIVAADVFIYIGELAPVFDAVARVLAPGGVFAFTVEHDETAVPYRLHRGLRYAHSEAGLRQLAAAHGLVVRQARPLVLREEQRQPVAGLVLALQRAA
jgi:predicted TPR repeat methyltransferase